MKKFLVITLSTALLLGGSWAALAQESTMSQYHHTPFLTNPGMMGVMDQSSVILNHRSQSVDAGKTYTTSTISGYHPIQIGNHRLGLGASLLSNQVAGFMGTSGGMLGTAYRVQLAPQHALSLGVQAGFFNRKLTSSFNFTTDSQFLNGSFNGEAPTGEVFVNQSRNFVTLTTGLFWQMQDSQGRSMAFAGASFFNVNQPNVGFDLENNLPASFQATAGLRAFQGERLSVVPNVRWLYRSDVRFVSAGTWLRYDLSESIESPQQISVGVWYNTNEAGVVALEYDRSRFMVAASYDIPLISDLNTFRQGGIFGVVLAFRVGNKISRQLVEKE